MQAEGIFALNLGLAPPWKVMSQCLDKNPCAFQTPPGDQADRGALYPCPECGPGCKVHHDITALGGISTSSCIIATSLPNYQGSIARNTGSDEWKPLGHGGQSFHPAF